jgi:hypothetical protein
MIEYAGEKGDDFVSELTEEVMRPESWIVNSELATIFKFSTILWWKSAC